MLKIQRPSKTVLIIMEVITSIIVSVFWFFDLRISNAIANYLFNLALAIGGFLLVIGVGKILVGKAEKVLSYLIALPIIAVSVSTLIKFAFTILMLIPPFTLGGLFYFDEMFNEKVVQTSISPDDKYIARVYYRAVGAYAGGQGRVEVAYSSTLMPFIERPIYYDGKTYFTEQDAKKYITWDDNNSIRINEGGQLIHF